MRSFAVSTANSTLLRLVFKAPSCRAVLKHLNKNSANYKELNGIAKRFIEIRPTEFSEDTAEVLV